MEWVAVREDSNLFYSQIIEYICSIVIDLTHSTSPALRCDNAERDFFTLTIF